MKFIERSCLKNKFLKVRSAANNEAYRLNYVVRLFRKEKKEFLVIFKIQHDDRQSNFLDNN